MTADGKPPGGPLANGSLHLGCRVVQLWNRNTNGHSGEASGVYDCPSHSHGWLHITYTTLCAQALVVGGIKRKPDGKIDYADDFFGKKAFMTVSGQLQVQTHPNLTPTPSSPLG